MYRRCDDQRLLSHRERGYPRWIGPCVLGGLLGLGSTLAVAQAQTTDSTPAQRPRAVTVDTPHAISFSFTQGVGGGTLTLAAGQHGITPLMFGFAVSHRNDLLNEMNFGGLFTGPLPNGGSQYDTSGAYRHTTAHEDAIPPLIVINGVPVQVTSATGLAWYEDPNAIWVKAPTTIAQLVMYSDSAAVQKYGAVGKYGAIAITTKDSTKHAP